MRRPDQFEAGFTLTELLVTLVIGTLLMTAVFSFFLNSSQIITNQSSTTDMWQRGRNALALVRQAVESAGFGLPSMSVCPNGVTDYATSGQTSPLALAAITASVQQAPSYDPTALSQINTYSFTTISGSSSFGSAPATTIASLPSLNASSLQVNDSTLLNPGDMAIISIPSSGACLLGQITNVSGKGTLQSNGSSPCTISGGKGGGGNTIVMNSSGSACYQFNPNQIFATDSSLLSSQLSSADFAGAPLYDLGNNHFLVNQFQIMDIPPGANQSIGTPTLYLTQYTANQSSTPTPQALARGVVDLQMQYGLGTNGAVTQWVYPENYTPSQTLQILAVKIGMLARSTRYMPHETSPATFTMPGGRTYTVPTANGPGCLQGDCRHYAYHLFESVVPVRNNIWGGP